MVIIEVLATIGTLLNVYLLGEYMIIWGSAIGAFGNVLWLYIGHEKNLFGIMVINVLLLFINIGNLI